MKMTFYSPCFAAVIAFGILVSLDDRLAVSAPPTELSEAKFDLVTGGKYQVPSGDDCQAVALIFFGHDCPISNAYAPEIARLHKEFAEKKVAFCVVYADADLSIRDARKHAKEYGLICPAILDPQMVLARKVGATIKPEVAVLSPKHEVLYRGRIDDINVDYGKRRIEPTSRELKDALTAILAGKPVKTPRTKAIGCDIYFPDDKK